MNKTVEIIPSLLSADFAQLAEEIDKIEQAGCKRIHLDIMDGHFVPNITFGPIVIEAIRKRTNLYLQAHLMIEHPEQFIYDFKRAGVDAVIVHQQVCSDFSDVLREIKKRGMHVGVALRPKTPIESIKDVIKDLDTILMMTVEPGFGGQTYIEGSERRIAETKALVDKIKPNVPIAVDGGINTQTASLMVKAGATRLIAGSAIFNGDVIENITALYRSIEEEG